MAGSDWSTVAFLGSGVMGAPMARNLAGAGLKVRAWNRTREKAEDRLGDVAEVLDSPEEAVSGADAVITMLADTGAVEEAMTGGGGALPALEDGTWIQMSTIGLAGTERMKATAAEAEVPFVDAPVLGTKEPAEQGELLVVASGPEDDDLRGRCAPLFDAMGRETMWVGEAGAGSRLKLVLNSWILSVVEGIAEAVGLSRALGVDPARFLEAIDGSPLEVPYANLKGQAMIDEEFPPSFHLALARKDADLVLEAAGDLELPFARAVAHQLRRAEEAGHGEEDMAAVFRVLGPDRGATRSDDAGDEPHR